MNRRGAAAAVAIVVAVGTGCASPPARVATVERVPSVASDRDAAPSAVPGYTVGAMRIEGAPPIDRAITADLDRYADLESSQLADLSPDGGAMLVIVGGEVHELRAPGAGAVRIRGLDVETARYGERGAIVVAGDRDGDEHMQVYVQTVGAPTRIGDGRGRSVDPIWNRAGTRLVWASTARDGVDFDLWTSAADGTDAHVAFTADARDPDRAGQWTPLEVSADDRSILARHTLSPMTSALYRIDLASGDPVALTATGAVASPTGTFGADGTLYAITDRGGDRLGIVASAGRIAAAVTTGGGDVVELARSSDGRTLTFTTASDGVFTLHLVDLATGRQRVAPGAPTGGVIHDLRFAAAAPVVGFTFSDARHPSVAMTYDLSLARVTAWTGADTRALPSPPIEPSHVAITARDGVTFSALVYRPAAATSAAAARHPVVVELHGGPEDQWQPRFAAFAQFLVARGYVVVQPNLRGSAGYGRAFAALDDGDHREAAVGDVGAVLDWIATQPDLDARAVGAVGMSYGGYLVLASLIAFPDRLRAGVEQVGIVDFPAFLAGTRADRRDSRRAEYGDERDPATHAFLTKISPMSHAGAIRAPLVVATGARDSRVPPAAAARLVAAVRAAGVPVWTLAASDEGHGFAKPANLDAYDTLVTQFLARYVVVASGNRTD